jgi:hypothetical protein
MTIKPKSGKSVKIHRYNRGKVQHSRVATGTEVVLVRQYEDRNFPLIPWAEIEVLGEKWHVRLDQADIY